MIVLTSAQEGGDGDGAFRPTTPPFASPFSSYFARLARRPGGGDTERKKGSIGGKNIVAGDLAEIRYRAG